DEFAVRNIPAKTACVTESLRLGQVGFSHEELFVQIVKLRGRLVENLAERAQFVSAGDRHAMIELAAPERLRRVHQPAEWLRDAARDRHAEESGEYERDHRGNRDDDKYSALPLSVVGDNRDPPI